MNDYLQAELWEIQIWIMWTLDLMLFETGHTIIGWLLLAYIIVCVMATIVKVTKAKTKDLKLTRVTNIQ